MTEGELQWVVVLEVEGDPYQLSHPEARDVIRWLRTAKPGEAEPDFKSVAAAVFLERLVDDPMNAENPPMNDEEAGAILIALGRMAVKEGLTGREAALHDALLGHFAPPSDA